LKTATLIYNPNVGSGAYSEKELVKLVEAGGYKCRHLSTKKKWKSSHSETDLIIVAGGDGTVRKIIKKLLEFERAEEIPPLALLPLGTANNISKTLQDKKTVKEIIASWKKAKIKRHDVGMIEGISKPFFFLESFGFGLFPSVMKKLKDEEDDSEQSPQRKLKTAQRVFRKCIDEEKFHECRLKIDGKDFSGKYLSVEIMNTTSLGPNVTLAPDADMADGLLDVVLIDEKNKNQLSDYLLKKTKEKKSFFPVTSIKGKKISIRWKGPRTHADGELIKISRYKKIEITIDEKVLKFLI
jgi:diacylglycerol kinase (ATP)